MPKHTCRKCGNSFDTDGKGKVISTPDKINKEVKGMPKSPAPPSGNREPGPNEKKCPRCSGVIPKDAGFCPYCGTDVKKLFGWKCDRCGALNSFDVNKCEHCGQFVMISKKGGREPPVLEPKGAGLLASVAGALGGRGDRGRQPPTLDDIVEYKQEEAERDIEAARKERERAAQIEREYAEEAEKARQAEVEAENLYNESIQKNLDTANRKERRSNQLNKISGIIRTPFDRAKGIQKNVIVPKESWYDKLSGAEKMEEDKKTEAVVKKYATAAAGSGQPPSGGPPGSGGPPSGGPPGSGGGGRRRPGPGEIMCRTIGCGEIYPISESVCPSCGERNPRFHLKPGEALCPDCGKVFENKYERCQHCGALNLSYNLKPNEYRCEKCGTINPVGNKTCKRCDAPNRGYVGDTKLSKSVKGRISTRVYEILIYELVGVFLIFGLPFFGLPQMLYLGIVLMALFPFYSYLPNEHEVLASVKRGEEEEGLGSLRAGSLIVKGMVKLLMFILTVFQFIVLPVSTLIPLAISFVYYFSLPTSYKVTQPFKLIEAWLRLGVGALVGGFALVAFKFTPQAWSLFWMALAFFCTSLPTHKNADEEEGVVKVQIFNKYGDISNKNGFSVVEKFIFFILMILAAFASQIPFTFSSMNVIYYTVWFLSLFTGLMAREGRPAMGILMILMTLFVFTFTATGVMGDAVFGYWWPQIYSFSESITGPLVPMWEQAQNGMGDIWLMFTNPMGYYDVIDKRNRATTSVVKQGGTTKSIEILSTNLFTSITGELEPIIDPLVGSFEIQNQGEFEANGIMLQVWATWQDPKTVSTTNPVPPTPIGILDGTKFSCSLSDAATSSVDSLPSIPPALPTSATTGVCDWPDTTYPKEIKFVNFVYKSSNDASNAWDLGNGDYLNSCINYDKSPIDCSDPNATYAHGSQTIKVNVNLTYSYNVNVSIPIEVINQENYRNLLLAKEITLQEVTSQYTGGPVKATLWSQKQPVRDSGEKSLFVASIVNEGSGTLNNITNFTIKIPTDTAKDVTLIAQTFQSIDKQIPPSGCNKAVIQGNYWVIYCQHNVAMKTGEYKRVSFFVIPQSVTERKTSLITGLANYKYTKTSSAALKIANAPWH